MGACMAPSAALLALAAAPGCQDLGGLAGGPNAGDGGKTKTDGSGGGSEGGVPTEGGTVVGDRCNRDKPFGAPELVTTFDPTSDYVKDAIQSRDQLEGFYLRYAG